jgi:hypothetical protein
MQTTNTCSEADPEDSGPGLWDPTPQEVGLRVGRRRAGPAGPSSLLAAGSPGPCPSESAAGGGREAHAGSRARRRPRGPWAGHALQDPRAPGFGSCRDLGSRNDPAGWDCGRTAGSPRGRASPQQSPPGPAHPQASRSLAELQTRVAPARRKERECGKLKGAAVPGRLCAAPFPPPGEVLRTAARSQKPVWWVNTALERPWIQQGFPSLMPGWRTTPCLSDLGLPAQALVLSDPRPPSTINGGF